MKKERETKKREEEKREREREREREERRRKESGREKMMVVGRLYYLLCLLLLLLLLLHVDVLAQVSDPVASDDVFDVGKNKFLTRQAQEPKQEVNRNMEEEPLPSAKCPIDLELRWMTEVSASVYATPLVTDLYSDGHKDVVVPSFVHYLEVLEGSNGAKAAGWPVNHKSTLHISPVQADCDFDGVPDVVVITYGGEIICYSDDARKIANFHIPALEIRKDWYVGLKPDHVDHEHPDVSNSEDEEALRGVLDGKGRKGKEEGEEKENVKTNVEVNGEEEGMKSNQNATGAGAAAEESESDVARSSRRRRALLQDLPENQENGLSDEASESFEVFKDDEYEFADEEDKSEEDPNFDPANYDEGYEDYGDFEDGAQFDHYDNEEWDDEYYEEFDHHHHDGDPLHNYISVDPHVLCTPTVADIDGDGYEDLIVAVTYMFDHELYSNPDKRDELGDDVDISNYLAGGVAAFDFLTMKMKWHTHLDLSTHHVNFQAYMYSSPTVADLNGDGKLEIVVGTSVGFVYVLDQNGTSLPGWPIQMGEVQAQVVLEDVNGDGMLEVVACDSRGNVAAFNAAGRELWERHVGALIANSPTVGDINGDGKTEIVVGTGSGSIFALDGATGKVVLSYQTNAMIMSSVLLAKLDDAPGSHHLHLVTMSFDGFLYLVHGSSGCADVVDIGETSYSTVLFEDLDNDGFMDLLVSTMNGNVYSFKTRSKFDPLKTWLGGQVATKLNSESIVFSPESRVPRDISGKAVGLTFEIRDKPPLSAPYTVTMKLRGVGIPEMNDGKNPVVGVSKVFEAPGSYYFEIPCPKSRTTSMIEVSMTDMHMKSYKDSFPVSFHMSFYRILKWLLALPLIAAHIAVLIFVNYYNANTDYNLVL